MNIHPIRNEADYQAALAEIEKLFDVPANTPEAERLDILVTLVKAYEDKHYPIEPPDPISAIMYHLESRGLSVEDLQNVLGSQQVVKSILECKQALTLEMIR